MLSHLSVPSFGLQRCCKRRPHPIKLTAPLLLLDSSFYSTQGVRQLLLLLPLLLKLQMKHGLAFGATAAALNEAASRLLLPAGSTQVF